MLDGKQKAIASRKSLTGQPKDEVHEMLLLNMMVKNSYRKQRQLKKELEEIDAQFRRLMDPDLPDRVKTEIAYLDEMIKGESQHIANLNMRNVKFKRLDFIGKEVQKEKQMVEAEDELMRIKVKMQNILD